MGFFVVAGLHVLPWAALSDEQEAWNLHWMAGSLACSHRPIPLGPYGVCGVCVCVCAPCAALLACKEPWTTAAMFDGKEPWIITALSDGRDLWTWYHSTLYL
jgi:hypothetical protein